MKTKDNITKIDTAFKASEAKEKKKAHKIVTDFQNQFEKLSEMGKQISENTFLLKKGVKFKCGITTTERQNSTQMVCNITISLPNNLDV